MSTRHKVYRWLRKSKGSFVRLLVLNIFVFVITGGIMIVLNRILGHDMAQRGGMEAWMFYLVGFSGILTLNTIIELMGEGYQPETRRRA